jgi:hypothetical protein
MSLLSFIYKCINSPRESATPDIVYPIDDVCKVVREQGGLSDLFPKYVLYRCINGRWYKRAWVYCSLFYGIKKAIDFLLADEQCTFTPLEN